MELTEQTLSSRTVFEGRIVTVKVDDTIIDSTGISQTSKSAIAIWGNQTVICNNVTFDMTLANSTAITSWWDIMRHGVQGWAGARGIARRP